MHLLLFFLLLTSQLVLTASQHGTVTHYTVEIALCFVMDGKSECKSGYLPFTFNRTRATRSQIRMQNPTSFAMSMPIVKHVCECDGHNLWPSSVNYNP